MAEYKHKYTHQPPFEHSAGKGKVWHIRLTDPSKEWANEHGKNIESLIRLQCCNDAVRYIKDNRCNVRILFTDNSKIEFIEGVLQIPT